MELFLSSCTSTVLNEWRFGEIFISTKIFLKRSFHTVNFQRILQFLSCSPNLSVRRSDLHVHRIIVPNLLFSV